MWWVLTGLAGIVLLHWIARIGDELGRRRGEFRVRPGSFAGEAGDERVSVLIPARDEEGNIGGCLGSVLGQGHRALEVIVLDDRSEDRTGEIVDGIAEQDGRVRRIVGEELAAGWKGKCFALHQAAAEATGEWLLMVDADVVLAPEALGVALGAVRRWDAEMLSWFGTMRTVTLWERVLQPLILDFILTHSDPRKVNDPARPECIANGQFVLIRAEVYRELGGHEAVKDSIVEDMALATLAKRRGFRYRLLEAEGLMKTRMYNSFGAIWRGWIKNFYAGLHGRRGVVVAAGIYLFVTGILPHLLAELALGAALLGAMHLPFAATAAAAVGAQFLYRLLIIRRAQPASLLSVLLHPVAAGLLAAIIAESARRAAKGVPVSWKGRDYDAGGGSTTLPE